MNGKLLKAAICSAAVTIEKNRKDIDELNVYPVPDGDTGTNMSMTMSAARRELSVMPDTATVAEVSEKAASAMLRGARGNSGVILSLLFRGFAKGLAGHEEADGKDIANAIEIGVQAAYKAVMKPTEGTILTVARMGAQQAQLTTRENNDPIAVFEETCKAAAEALANTPEQLPILKKAGVVDAGGKGLLTVWEAMLAVFHGEEPAQAEEESAAPAKKQHDNIAIGRVDLEEEITHTYCTEFIVQKHKDCPDPFKLRAYLETIGDCVVVVDDDDIIKVHVHTDDPGLALQKALEFGQFVNEPKPKVENMRIQHAGRVREAQNAAQDETYVRAEPEKQFGFVAVAAGEGLVSMFRDLGADNVVQGGQTMNPSTDDILRAIHATPAKNVFVLPNNKNIIMAAEQAVSLADRNVLVLPTRTIPQGMSAMMAFDESLDAEGNRLSMTRAFERVSTGQVTFAARDSEIDGHPIKKGEVLALDNGKLSFTDKELNHAAYKLAKKLVSGDSSFLTVYYGADVDEETAEALNAKLQDKFGDKLEVILVNGGQPVYYYMIAAE